MFARKNSKAVKQSPSEPDSFKYLEISKAALVGPITWEMRETQTRKGYPPMLTIKSRLLLALRKF